MAAVGPSPTLLPPVVGDNDLIGRVEIHADVPQVTWRMLTGVQFNETSLPLPISREVATSSNGALQARRAIGGTSRRPVVAGELANHERVLRLPPNVGLPVAGTNPSRIDLLRERLARAIRRDFGSRSSSGATGTPCLATRRNRAIPSLSARNHASTLRTAIRKHIPGAGSGRNRRSRRGAHSSRSRSQSANHGECRAPWLKRRSRASNAGILV